MEALSKNAVADLLVKNEIGYFEREIFEVRSFWKNYCIETEDKERAKHFCEKAEKEIEITLYPFKTLYNRYWLIGGCKYCKKIIYHSLPLDL